MQSTQKNKFLFDQVRVGLNDRAYYIQIYDTPLGRRWITALKNNLDNKRVLEKNFCWLGWVNSNRNLHHLVNELNSSIVQINNFKFAPPYEEIHSFVTDDFQYSAELPMGDAINGLTEKDTPGLRLKHDSCNLLHRYFEELQGTAWKLSEFYKQADYKTKYAIRQLNNICHEIESWVESYRKSILAPEWVRPSQITTFLNSPRYDLHDEDYELFKQNRYNRELGGVYLHWSQVGKTLYEVFRDEGGIKMDVATCSEINHQKYYSGEFDVEWGQTITENQNSWKKEEIDKYRGWLADNGYEWDDPKLSLGYIKLGQVSLEDKPYSEIYHNMKNNLNISCIEITGDQSAHCRYPYTLESDDWKEIQMDFLKEGYESRSMR